MPRRVTIAPAAAEGFGRARLWLLQPGSGPAGLRRWEALREARRRLRDHPYLGTPSADHPGLRQLVVAEHRLIYRLVPDTGDAGTAGDVLILALFGPGQA